MNYICINKFQFDSFKYRCLINNSLLISTRATTYKRYNTYNNNKSHIPGINNWIIEKYLFITAWKWASQPYFDLNTYTYHHITTSWCTYIPPAIQQECVYVKNKRNKKKTPKGINAAIKKSWWEPCCAQKFV